MKKLMAIIMACLTAVACCFALTACGSKNVKVYAEYELTSESYAFLIKKGNSELVDSVNGVLDEIKASGELDSIINSFFNGEATFTYTNPVGEIPTDHSQYFIVATNAYFPPFEYYDGDKLTGVDMQIASIIAQKLNKTLYIADMKFSAIFTSVETGESDIGMAGITVTDKRKETYDFSKEYYESAQVLMVAEDDKLFADCKSAEDVENVLKAQGKDFVVGTQEATTGYMFMAGDVDFEYDGFTNLTTESYKNGALAAKDLSNGKINAVVIDKQPAIMIAKSING